MIDKNNIVNRFSDRRNNYTHKSVVCILQGSKDILFKEFYVLINCKAITF